MNERGKSDSPVVPAKPPNKTSVTEVVEGRGLAKGNTASATRPGHRAGSGVPNGLDRVRESARRDKGARFTALLHHVDLDRLRAAYWAIRPKAAPGVDGVTWEAYGHNLGANLQDLNTRLHTGCYRASPSRRAYHAGGQDRPAGCRRGAQRRLRGGFPRFLLWVSAGAQPASRVGCTRGRDRTEEDELGARRARRRDHRAFRRTTSSWGLSISRMRSGSSTSFASGSRSSDWSYISIRPGSSSSGDTSPHDEECGASGSPTRSTSSASRTCAGRPGPDGSGCGAPRQEPSALAAHAGICAGGRPQGRSLPRSILRP